MAEDTTTTTAAATTLVEASTVVDDEEDAETVVTVAAASSNSKKKGKKNNQHTAPSSNQAESKEVPARNPVVAQPLTTQLHDPSKNVKVHKFWDTQPVPKLYETVQESNGAIEANKAVSELRQEPFKLPDNFQWSELDVTQESVLAEIYTLLNENYVEDDDAMFRFDYKMPFLQWALTPPNYCHDFHLGVRWGDRLMAFITGVPAVIRVRGADVKTVEINYLCVHKKLRSKRLAPVLIKEITRRVNLKGIFQAVYTAGVVLPKPLASCRYWHRSLDPKKLIEIGFSRLTARMTMARTIRLFRLPATTTHPFVPLQPAHLESARQLVSSYLAQFLLYPQFEPDEFAHTFLPKPQVVDCFVKLDDQGVVTDLLSFYHLPSTVIGNDKHSTLNAAYSFYNVATTIAMVDLMRDALVCAKNAGMDVFNALDIMENDSVFKELKFGIGDGRLQYYLYNWRTAQMDPKNIGLVLL